MKRIFSIGIITVLALLLMCLTGCGDNKIKESDNANNKATQNTENASKDGGAELIYEFSKYIQDKDAEKMASLFNEKYMVVKNSKYYNYKELANKFNQVFADDTYESYKVIDVHKISNEADFNKYWEDEISENYYDKYILESAKLIGDNVLIYIVDVEYNGTETQDVMYVSETNGKYVIERSTTWSFMMAANNN